MAVLTPDQMGNRSGLQEIQKEKLLVIISKILSQYNVRNLLLKEIKAPLQLS